MHIVDVTMFYAPGSGGVRRYLEAKHVFLRGRHQHTVVVPGGRRGRDGTVIRLAAPRLPGAGGYRFPLRGRPWAETLVALAPDVIESGDPYRLGWVARAAAQRAGIPAVAFYHSDLARFAEVRLGGLGRRAAGLYLTRLYAGFDRVLAPSRAMVERLHGFGLTHVGLQPLGVDTARFHPRHRDPDLKLRLGLSRDTRLLLFVGRHAPEKNIPLLCAAVRQLGRPYHLLLVGPGMPRTVARNITVWPRFVRSDLPRLLASADAFVHAGDQETFGLVVLEAMASGTPVAGCAAGAVPELVSPETGVLARPRDAGALAGAVDALFACDLQRMGSAARERVEQRWTWSAVLPGLLHQYRIAAGARLREFAPATDAGT